MTREVPIFFSVDDVYAPLLAVALNSAVKNSNPERRYVAHVLNRGLSDENIKKLGALATDNFRIDFRPMTADMNVFDDRINNRLRHNYFTLTIYFRLFIPTMFPDLDKGLYLDSDVVLTDDVAKLFDTEIGDNFFGACHDLSIADNETLVGYTETAIGVRGHEYINSGVLLMNLKKMRDCDLEGHFLDLLTTYHFDSVAPDQDYLNAMCNGKIFYLDKRWDAMPNNARPTQDDPGLIHYNLFEKPWCYDNVQYADVFWKYAEDCGFIREIREHKESYTDEQREIDRDAMGVLVRRCMEIPLTEITFRKLHEKGVRIRL